MKTIAKSVLGSLLLVMSGLGAEDDGLSDADRAQLERDKILIGTREYRQSFEPYIMNKLPVFITSDAVLNAFHVIFEESFSRMESANVALLESLLERMAKSLPQAVEELKGADQWKKHAAQRAEIMVKTALRLLGRGAAGSDKAVEQIIAAQVKEIEAATGARKPQWLGPPDAGFQELDFTRYAPRGFYSRSARMQRYFRAVSWLQSVPFRLEKDEEFLSVLFLGRALSLNQPGAPRWPSGHHAFLDAWSGLLPGRDDPDLREMMEASGHFGDLDCSNGASLTERRQVAKERHFTNARYHINDQVRLAPVNGAEPAEPQYRVLPASALPDGVLFQKTSFLTKPRVQRFPDTLEVAAGLGSSLASELLRKSLEPEVWDEVEIAIHWMAKREPNASLYDEYLNCLHELVDVSDPAAPAFMRGEAWRRKSCQTVLASWAKMRHTLLLQAKHNYMLGAGVSSPPGFVEPEPEFFRRLGEVSLRCLTFFGTDSVADDNSETVIVAELQAARDAADALHRAAGDMGKVNEMFALSRGEWRVEHALKLPEHPSSGPDDSAEDAKAKERREKEHEPRVAVWAGQVRDAFDQLMAKLERADPAERAKLLVQMQRVEDRNLRRRWEGLVRICSQAQSIAHLQLRGVSLTETQKGFIREFGLLLAQAMFYDANSYVRPQDDAPRVADVFTWPGKGILHAGIGRPRVFYVLYPWAGDEVLCVGAVLPYYEVKEPDRLSDAVWRVRLRENPPGRPKWVEPVIGPGK